VSCSDWSAARRRHGSARTSSWLELSAYRSEAAKAGAGFEPLAAGAASACAPEADAASSWVGAAAAEMSDRVMAGSGPTPTAGSDVSSEGAVAPQALREGFIAWRLWHESCAFVLESRSRESGPPSPPDRLRLPAPWDRPSACRGDFALALRGRAPRR
jgi:hypothetical protein